MTTQIPYIDRKAELDLIDQAIRAKTRLVIGIQAEGGVGKTRLLQEIQRRYQDIDEGKEWRELNVLVVENILDFDDRANQIPQNVGRRIAQMLGAQFFKSYLRGLLDYQKLKKAEARYTQLQEAERMNNQEFVRCFNQVTRKQRVVLLLDTTEKFTTDMAYLLDWIKQSENAVWILVGRPNAEVLQWIISEQSREFIFRELKDLSPEASREYLQAKQQALHFTLESELTEKLLNLVQGRPILIDLAVELRTQKNLSDWLGEIDILPIANLTEDKIIQKRHEFECKLVSSVAETREPINWLTLAMAHVYPLDIDILGHLLDLSFTEAQDLFQEAQDHVFVKLLPDGRITLHDEMRRMVQTYVWPEVDPDGDQRQEYSKIAVDYFRKQENALREQIAQLQASLSQEDEELELTNSLHRQIMERESWVVQESLLYHVLVVDIEQGVDVFVRLFDEATRAYAFEPRKIFYTLMERYNFEEISSEHKYEFYNRKIRLLNDMGQFAAAQDLAIMMLFGELKNNQRLDLLTLSGRSYELSHNLLEAREQYKAALEMCECHPELSRWKVTLLKNLGRVTREMRLTDEALGYYQQALFITQDPIQIAATLNSIGYIWSLQGRYRGAHKYCRKALLIYKELNRDRDIGTTLATIGEVFRSQNHYAQAMEYYYQALPYFQRANDLIWLARLYSRRGAVHRLQGNYSLALKDLEASLECNIKEEQPWVYHVLGCVYWEQGNWDAAEEKFHQSDKLAYEVGDVRSQVNNLVGYAELYYDCWEGSQLKDNRYPRLIREKATQLEVLLQQGYGFEHHYGRMKRVLADVYYYEADYDQAFQNYQEAFTLLGSRLGSYARAKDDFESIADWLFARITELATLGQVDRAINWCQDFRKHWANAELHMMHKDLLLSMCDICEMDIKLRGRGVL